MNRSLWIPILLAAAWTNALGSPTPSSQPYRWRNVSIVGGGFISGLLYHPNKRDVLYARTDIGGAYRWDAKGSRWIPLLDWIQRPDWNLYGVESMALDQNDPRRLYLAVGTYLGDFASNGEVLRSSDQGRTFQRSKMPFRMGGNQDGRSMGERLAVDPNDGQVLALGSRTGELWVSVDRAQTWDKVTSFKSGKTDSGIGVGAVTFDPSSSRKGERCKDIYVCVASKSASIWHSDDAGKSWKSLPNQPTGIYPHHAQFGADGWLYLAYGNGPGPNGVTNGAVWKYHPSTGEWKDITPEMPTSSVGFGYGGLSVDPRKPGYLAVTTLDHWSGGDELYVSEDAGEHWKGVKRFSQMDPSNSPFLKWGQKEPKFGWWMGTVQIDPFRPDTILFGTGATIWGTDKISDAIGGKTTTWTARTIGLEETAVLDLMSPPTGAHLFSAVGDIGGFRHEDFDHAPKEGMQANPIFSDSDSIDFAELAPSVMVRVGRGNAGVAHGATSLDGGLSWKPFASEPPRSGGGGSVAISADGKRMVWSPFRSEPYVSIDSGKFWVKSSGGTANMKLAADRQNPQLFYGIGGGEGHNFYYISNDGGLSFQKISELPHGNLECIKAVPGKSGDVWMVAGNRVLHAMSTTTTPVAVKDISDANAVGFGRPRSGSGYPSVFLIGAVSGVEGAFRSDDGGNSWTLITDAQHGFGTMGHITGDPRLFGRVYIGTNGRGVLYGDPK